METGCPVLAYTELFPPDTIEFLSLRASSASREYTFKKPQSIFEKNFEFCSPCWKCLLLPRGFGSLPRGLYWQGLVVDHVCRSPVVQGTPEKYKKSVQDISRVLMWVGKKIIF